jgi:hypothetical protein
MKLVRIMVRRHGRHCVATVREAFVTGSRRLHRTQLYDDPREAQSSARVWSRIHGFTVRYTAFEHGLVGPGALGDITVEAE